MWFLHKLLVQKLLSNVYNSALSLIKDNSNLHLYQKILFRDQKRLLTVIRRLEFCCVETGDVIWFVVMEYRVINRITYLKNNTIM